MIPTENIKSLNINSLLERPLSTQNDRSHNLVITDKINIGLHQIKVM
jgi:hypothetical protein